MPKAEHVMTESSCKLQNIYAKDEDNNEATFAASKVDLSHFEENRKPADVISSLLDFDGTTNNSYNIGNNAVLNNMSIEEDYNIPNNYSIPPMESTSHGDQCPKCHLWQDKQNYSAHVLNCKTDGAFDAFTSIDDLESYIDKCLYSF